MTEQEKKLTEDYKALQIIIDIYSQNRMMFQMTDKEFYNHINDLLDEMNIIRKELEELKKNK